MYNYGILLQGLSLFKGTGQPLDSSPLLSVAMISMRNEFGERLIQVVKNFFSDLILNTSVTPLLNVWA